MTSEQHLNAYRWGKAAETLGCIVLLCKGFNILERRWRSVYGEIDIIAKRGNHIHFIEVKARATARESIEALSWRQRERINRTAIAYLATTPAFSKLDMHLDLIYVCPWAIPRHLQDAWDA